MHANNRSARMPAAHFRTAGGNIYKYSHPFLSGQVSANTLINEVDVSACLKLNDTFFNASPAQDSAFQEPLVDGSVLTITNHLMSGTATLQVMPTSGLVGGGDLIAVAHFIIASKDDVGGILKRVKFANGRALTRIYYGVAFKNVPHDIDAGNAAPAYPIVMTYSGWIEGVSLNDVNTQKALWAVGNKYGLQGNFTPFSVNGVRVNEGEAGDFFSTSRGRLSGVDTGSADYDNVAPDSIDPRPDGLLDGFSRYEGA